jgi:hypothetical protein
VTKNAPERNLQTSFQLILIIKAYHKADCSVHLNSSELWGRNAESQ